MFVINYFQELKMGKGNVADLLKVQGMFTRAAIAQVTEEMYRLKSSNIFDFIKLICIPSGAVFQHAINA